MNYNTNLQTNNTSLQAIYNTVNALPDKDSLPAIKEYMFTLEDETTISKYIEEGQLSIDFTDIQSITIPEGTITKISCDNVVLWEKSIEQTATITTHLSGVNLSGNSLPTTIPLGDSFTAFILTINGHPADVIITMGGEDVTSIVFDGNSKIYIPSVTGDIVITASERLVNLLPKATDTDRVTIYNGTGYYNGKRWSASGNKISTGSGTSMTGFIDCKPGDVLRVYNYTQQGGTNWYIVTFNDSQTVVKCIGQSGVSPSGGYVSPGYCEITLTESTYGSFTSIRLSWGQFNSESIVTINQEIPH